MAAAGGGQPPNLDCRGLLQGAGLDGWVYLLLEAGLANVAYPLFYQRYRVSAMRAEALYGRAQSEAEAAEKHLLEVSRAAYSGAAEQAVVWADMVPETTGSVTHR